MRTKYNWITGTYIKGQHSRGVEYSKKDPRMHALNLDDVIVADSCSE